MRTFTALLLGCLALTACSKEDKRQVRPGWNGVPSAVACNYVPTIHQGALQNVQSEIVAINADPANHPMDQLQVLICTDVACSSPHAASNCSPLNSGIPCSTSMPSPNINIATHQVIFFQAYQAGMRGYFISEAVCN